MNNMKIIRKHTHTPQ